MSIKATSTQTYSGAQMLTKNGMATPSTDTSFWASFTNLTQISRDNGWATLTRSATNVYSNFQTSTSSVDLVGGNTYTAIVEIDNCSISSGQVIFVQTSAASDPVNAFTVTSGCDYIPSAAFMGVNLNGNSTSKYNVYTFTTKSSFTRGLRYFIDTNTGVGSLDIRATILAGDHSSDWQNYCGDNYEPYVGSTPSPLVKGVAHVSTSKNLLNIQSGSNGEYFGTTSQQTYSGKNLFEAPIVPKDTWRASYTKNSDNSFTVTTSQGATESAYAEIDLSSLPKNTQVTLSFDVDKDIILIRPRINNTWGAGYQTDGSGYTFTTGSTSTSIAFYTLTSSYSEQSITLSNIQIETGPTVTTYEPYVGGIASPNPDYPQDVITGKLASKNLCPDIAEGYYVTSTSTGWGKTAVDSGVLIAVEPNTNYTISTTATQSRYRFCFVSSLGNYNGYNGGVNDGGSNTYTKNSGSYPYLIVNATDLSKIQVEKGSRATEFEPYFTPIELTQVSTYQDKVYKNGNSWYVRKETNSLNMKDYKDKPWYISQYQGNSYVVKCQKTDLNIPDMIFDAGSQLPTSDICNYFTAEPTIQLYQGAISVGFGITTDGIYFSNNSWSVNDFKNFVDNHDVLIYYRKNTPTDTAITDSTTIAWLNKYDTDSLPHHKYVNTRRTTYVGASGLASAIDLYDGSYASALPTYTTANDHHLTTANGGTYTVSLQNISAKIVSGTVTFSVFTNQRKIDFSWNGSATSTNVSVSLQTNEYIKSIYAYIPQDADAGITLSQQLESGSLTDFEPYYNIVKIYAGDDLVFEDTSLTD